MHYHHIGIADEARYRRNVANEIEIELSVQRRVVRVRRAGHEERIAVGRRAHDHLGSDVGAGARPVFDNDRLGPSRSDNH
jgi:hypothetical protein